LASTADKSPDTIDIVSAVRESSSTAASIPVGATLPRRARVLFDEAHSEAWTIRPDLAVAMQPSHPRDSSYMLAAAALAQSDFAVRTHIEGPLCADRLRDADVLVIAHPSDPAWERTTGTGSPRFSASEIDAIEGFVRSGGGLIVLGETENEKYGNNLNELLAPYRLRLENETVQDYAHHYLSTPSWVLGELTEGERGRGGDLLARVRSACFYRATTITAPAEAGVPVRTSQTATRSGAPLIAAVEHGDGRVVVLADSDLFGDDCVAELDHEELWRNLVSWCARHAFAAEADARESAARIDPAWARLRDGCDALALLQGDDGSIAGDPGAAPQHVATISEAIATLAHHFPHQTAYIDAVIEDLRAWTEAGFERQDFTRSSAPSCTAKTASSTWWCCRCTSRTRRARRASRR
jgi:hypothetical protein